MTNVDGEETSNYSSQSEQDLDENFNLNHQEPLGFKNNQYLSFAAVQSNSIDRNQVPTMPQFKTFDNNNKLEKFKHSLKIDVDSIE